MKPHSHWYVGAMERLIKVVQDLSQAKDLETIMAIVRLAARDLTGADGATFVLRDGDHCYYAEENAISPLWKGRRFPMKTCISGWAMENAECAIIEDIYNDPRIPVDAYRPTFVKSLVMVPIRKNAPIGAIGNYWAKMRQPLKEEVTVLQALADTTSVALENAELYKRLQEKIATLEQREIQIQEQQNTLEIFTRALAHDLKEPIRTIASFTELIAAEKSLPEKSERYFGYVQSSADRMLQLIDAVSLYMQLDDPKQMMQTHCDMTVVLLEVQENLAQLISERKALITWDTLPTVYANHVQLVQLFQNLLCNAIYHNDNRPLIHISAEKQEGRWLFSVCDNGRGIEAKNFDKIFEPFKRLKKNKEEGFGLGLAICKKVIQFHDSDIWCESQAGKGTTFFFTLPAAPSKTRALTEENVPIVSPLHGNVALLANVLLVDDRKVDIELTRLLLTEKLQVQCNLFMAESGEEALVMLYQQTKENMPIHLVLLDINMPGMDGFEVLEHMKSDKHLHHIAVLMCTGSTYVKDQERAKTLGAAGYLMKPLTLEGLKGSINQLQQLKLYQDGAFYSLRYVAG